MNRKDIRHLDKKRLAALFDFAEKESETDGQAADGPSAAPVEADRGHNDGESSGVDTGSPEEEHPPPSPMPPGENPQEDEGAMNGTKGRD